MQFNVAISLHKYLSDAWDLRNTMKHQTNAHMALCMHKEGQI